MAVVHARKVAALLLVAAGTAFADDGSHRPPAFKLGDVATPAAYEVRLEIDPKAATFAGEARVAFRVNWPTPVVWLNATGLDIESVELRQGGLPVRTAVLKGGRDFIGLASPDSLFDPVETVAHFRYRGEVNPLDTRGIFRQSVGEDAYVLTQFEALSARRAFPSFDEPGWKTPWKLAIDAPAGNVVAANTPEVRVLDAPGRTGWRRHEFAETKPLPTYLVAFAVGPFDVVDGGTAGMKRTPLRYLVPKGRAGDTRFVREATPKLLEIIEAYFGIPYPFEKLDSAVIPQAVGFGAMENVGLITYDQQFMLASPSAETHRFRRSYAGIAAHEIAHMWFGNSVTLAWWDDIWLNEAFATWMGEKAKYTLRPDWDSGDYRARERAEAIELDRLASARRVRNPVAVREDMSGAFSAITYQKGAAVLEMFEAWIGPERFRAGVRDYLQRYAYGSATSADFFAALSNAAGRGERTLEALRAFVDQPGVPLLDAALRCEGTRGTLELSQQRLRPKGSQAPPQQWTTPACFRHPGGTICEDVGAEPRSIALPSCPEWVVGNVDGTGHYVVRYDDALSKRIARSMARLPGREAVTLASDAGLLAQSGLIPDGAALAVADTALAHPSPAVKLSAVRLLQRLRDDRLDPAELRRKREIVTRRLQPLARSLGWRERDRDPEDLRELRIVLLPFAAQYPGGEALRRETRTLVIAWQRDHASVPAAVLPAILDTAARFADRATYELLESMAITSRDARERRQLQSALAKVRDPVLRTRALSLALAKSAAVDAIGARDVMLYMRDALEDDANRAAAFDFVRARYDELAAKMPENTPARFTTYLKDLCRPEDRDAFVAFFKDRTPKLLGGQRRYDEALETIELCIAARAG